MPASSGAAAAPPSGSQSPEWEQILIGGHAPLVRGRRMFRLVPSAPRCKMCNNPFGGLGGRLFRLAGFKPSRKNPTLCTRCCDSLPAGGAEVDIAVLFADVRGSTAIGGQSGPTEFAQQLNRLYAVATETLIRHDAVIDKLIGDEVMAFFVSGISGPEYRRRAVEAGLDLLHALGYGTPEGPWVEVGMAVNAGVAYVGNVGGAVVDFTALGDTVNIGARMQGQAAAGELLIGQALGEELGLQGGERTLDLRGHEGPVEALVLTA
jgi:adenylate cyclase